MRFLISLFLFLTTFAFAQAFAQAYSTAIEADLTGDGLIDFAELYESTEPGNADLNIWVRNENDGVDLSSRSMAIVWLGGPGQQPKLMLTDHGALQVVSMNAAIGRNRWEQTLTLAYRNGVFVLAGFTYNWYDTLDLENSGTCDVNLLTGKGERTKGTFLRPIEFRTKSRAGPIDKWDGNPPTECFPNN